MKKNIFNLLFLLLFISGCHVYKSGIVENKKLLNPTSSHLLYFYLICVKDTEELEYLSNERLEVGDTIYIINRGKR